MRPSLRHAAMSLAFAWVAPFAAAAGVDETPAYWFVELAGRPVADGGIPASVRAEKAAFRANARSAGIELRERFAYDKLFNGLSVSVPRGQLARLSQLDGVKAVYPVGKVARPITSPLSPELATAIAMTGADVVQSELGFTGSGVKVGVIDTGIDYNHPDLGGCFGGSCRVAAGYDFVGDAYDADLGLEPVPDPDPNDCHGHGTHVAGIIGANGAVKGVAPEVTFGAYRVFGCEGSTTDDLMVAAMERALDDGMRVVNISIGSPYEWPQSPSAAAASRLASKGVVVVASIGNITNASGSQLYSASAPAVGENVIGVASFDNTAINRAVFTISPDDHPVAYGPAAGAPSAPLEGSGPMMRTGTTTTVDDGCDALAANSLDGAIALIRRGTCSFYTKAMNAQQAGATAMVVYNNIGGVITPSVTPPAGQPPVTIPVVGIGASDGALINQRMDLGPVLLTWTRSSTPVANANGGLLSSFNAWGLAPDLALKPDIGAPGGYIRSTYPESRGSYAILSGTSMASPHVAGAAALLLQAKPKLPANAVRGVLMSAADPALWWGNPSLGLLDTVHRQGAGMLRIDEAILSSIRVDPAKIALGESQGGGSSHVVTVRNDGNVAVTFDLSHVGGVATGSNTWSISYFTTAGVVVTFSPSELTVKPKSFASFVATFTAPPEGAVQLHGGYLVLTARDSGEVYRVPYAGYAGNYQAKQVMTDGGNGLPWLARSVAGDFQNLNGVGGTFTLADASEMPYFLVHLDHQARTVRLDISEVGSGNWQRAFEFGYFPRNSLSSSFFAFAWDGMIFKGRKTFAVPNGQYVAKLSVLKPLGDARNPLDWEWWASDVITVARP